MKKSLFLFAVASVFALNTTAQTAVAPQRVKFDGKMEVASKTAIDRKADLKNQGARKAYSDQVYYTAPLGGLYPGQTAEGMSYNMSMLYVPSFSEFSFANMCANKAASDWYFVAQDGTENSYQENTDDEMNLRFGVGNFNGYYYYIPRVRVGNTSYFLGESGTNAQYSGVMPDTIDYYRFYDNHTAKRYGWGSLQPDRYLFGSGYFDVTSGDDETAYGQYVCDGVAQRLEKPISPLYVEKILVPIYTNNQNPLNGKEITLQIRNIEYNETEDGTYAEPGSNILYEFTASADDLVEIELSDHETEYTTTGKVYMYTMVFSQKERDIVGNLIDVPFTLTDECYMMITGFAQDGVNLGVLCGGQKEENEVVYGCWAISAREDGRTRQAWYGRETCLNFSFYGGNDYCEVYDNLTTQDGVELSNLNVLDVSADGTEIVNRGYPGLANTVLMDAAFAWADFTTGNVNYNVDFDEMPEWVQIEGTDGENGQISISVECDPLPAGETGRYAVLYIEGHGYKSNAPIYILQGDVDEGLAIQNVETTKKVDHKGIFNIAGQRVNDNFKGIIINNGKKEIKK